jgi:hypothetical protein
MIPKRRQKIVSLAHGFLNPTRHFALASSPRPPGRPRPATVWPPICDVANLPGFIDLKSASKWNNSNGHLPILATWRCSHCGMIHYWSTSASNSSGKHNAGADRIPDRILELIESEEKL